MKTRLYALAGAPRAMYDIIKTATDWQATEIVLIGQEAIAESAERLRGDWATYQIPLIVGTALGAEEEILVRLTEPPFIGTEEVSAVITDVLTETNAVIVNEVLDTVRTVERSKHL